METSDSLRQQIIESLKAPQPEKAVDAAINLWQELATHIISIVGEDGFNSLYMRSVFLSQSRFPWLTASTPSVHNGQRFAELKLSFKGQTPAQAVAANSVLLITFTDILASLIGEPLTARILHSAWSNHASDKVGKESQDE